MSPRYDEDSGGSGDEGRNEAHKREWNLFYQKQMNLRKGKDPKTEEFEPPDEDCLLKEASSRKIPRLTVKAREHCLRLLEEALSSNHQATGPTEGPDPQAKAVELEHETFRNAKVANLYKASVLKKVAEIRRASKDGQPYIGGTAKSHGAQAEPPETNEYDIRPASQVYSLKHRRLGAGFPKGSCLFQTATELIEKTQAKEQAPQPERGGKQEPPGGTHSLLDKAISEPQPEPRGEAPQNSAHCGEASPGKETKGTPLDSSIAKARTTKKKQLLATAAFKDSQDISRFFCPRAKSLLPPSSAPGVEGASPSYDKVQGPPVTPEDCKGEEDRTLEHLAVPPQTEECIRERPSVCPLIDQAPPEDQLTPIKETQKAKRPVPQQENPESQIQKRPCLSVKTTSVAEAMGAITGRDQDTSNPTARGSCLLSAPTISLKETANVVVKFLTPFYKEGKFASKELFKGFARYLSHTLAQRPSPGRRVKEEALNLIRQFFHGRARCESEADWHNLCGP